MEKTPTTPGSGQPPNPPASSPAAKSQNEPLDLSIWGSRKRPSPVPLPLPLSASGPVKRQVPIARKSTSLRLPTSTPLMPSIPGQPHSAISVASSSPRMGNPLVPVTTATPLVIPPVPPNLGPFDMVPQPYLPGSRNWLPPATSLYHQPQVLLSQPQQQHLLALQHEMQKQPPTSFAVLQHAAAMGDLDTFNLAQQALQQSAALYNMANRKAAVEANQNHRNFTEQEIGKRASFQSPLATPPLPKMPKQCQNSQQHCCVQSSARPATQTTPLTLRMKPAISTDRRNSPHGNVWVDDTVKQVNTCIICRRSFDSLPDLTRHMSESKHFKTICCGGGGNGSSPAQLPNSRPSRSVDAITSDVASDLRTSSRPQSLLSIATMTPPYTPVEKKYGAMGAKLEGNPEVECQVNTGAKSSNNVVGNWESRSKAQKIVSDEPTNLTAASQKSIVPSYTALTALNSMCRLVGTQSPPRGKTSSTSATQLTPSS